MFRRAQIAIYNNKEFKGRISCDRVLYRGGNNANANAGVAYTNANNDASNANTNIGSRLD